MDYFLLGGALLLSMAVLLFVSVRRRVARTEAWIRVPAEIVDVVADNDGGGRPLFAYTAPDGSRRLWQSKVSKYGPGLTPQIGNVAEARIDPTDYNKVTIRGWDGANLALTIVGGLILVAAIVLLVIGTAV